MKLKIWSYQDSGYEDVVECNLEQNYRRFTGTYFLHGRRHHHHNRDF
jgi:hypothetical protein